MNMKEFKSMTMEEKSLWYVRKLVNYYYGGTK